MFKKNRFPDAVLFEEAAFQNLQKGRLQPHGRLLVLYHRYIYKPFTFFATLIVFLLCHYKADYSG